MGYKSLVLNTRLRIWSLKRSLKIIGITNWIYNHTGRERIIISHIITARKQKNGSEKLYQTEIVKALAAGHMLPIKRQISSISHDIAGLFVAMDSRNKETFSKKKDSVEREIGKLNYKLLDYAQWRRLLHILMSNGCLTAGMLIRKKMEQILSDQMNTAADLDILGMLIENGKYKDALRLMNESRYLTEYRHLRKGEIEAMKRFCRGVLKGGYQADDRLDNELENQFYEYVKGRTVTVIGPAYRDSYDQVRADIPDDCVLEILSYLPTYTYEHIIASKKPDIVFYNGAASMQLRALSDKSFLRDVKFIVSKAGNQDEVDFGDQEINRKSRYAIPGSMYSHLVMIGELNQVQLILADLMCFGADVLVLNSNLYYAEKEYMDQEDCEDYFERMENFYAHDLIANFKFMKSLYDRGKFRMDDMGQKVMNLTLEQYVGGIEKIHLNKYFRSRE